MNDAQMDTPNNIRKHDRIQMEIVSACRDIGIEAIQEYAGQVWRPDVFIRNNGKPIAFEIQLSPQSLQKTLERQSKYIRDGIVGCWLFENPISKLNEERPDLPVFYGDIMYGPKGVTHQGEIELRECIELPIPHWCFPDNKQFCNEK